MRDGTHTIEIGSVHKIEFNTPGKTWAMDIKS